MEIPTDYEVQPVPENWPGAVTCGTCGLSWDDSVSTSLTPVPSGRCPFEYLHDSLCDECDNPFDDNPGKDVCKTCEEWVVIDTRPIIDIAHNGSRWHIGVTELDERGYGVRAFVLAIQDEHTVDAVMLRRFRDMVRLMGDNVQVREGCEQYLSDDND